jgi:hypothetical protein
MAVTSFDTGTAFVVIDKASAVIAKTRQSFAPNVK